MGKDCVQELRKEDFVERLEDLERQDKRQDGKIGRLRKEGFEEKVFGSVDYCEDEI